MRFTASTAGSIDRHGPQRPRYEKGPRLSNDVVSAYTLVIGDEDGPAKVSVHATADDAWRTLDLEVRRRSRLRARPRRRVDAEATARLADTWRTAERGNRFWQIRPHQLPIMVPDVAPRVLAAASARR